MATKRTVNKKAAVKATVAPKITHVVNKAVAPKITPVKKAPVKPTPKVVVDTVAEIPTPVEVPIPPVRPTPKVVVDRDVAVLNLMLDNYEKLYNTEDNDHNLELRIAEFSKIIRYIVNNPTNKVLERMLEFFVKESHAMMSYCNTLRFISHLSPTEREKCSTFYTVFTELVDCKKHGKKFSLNINAIGVVLQSDPIINFIAMQINK